MLTDVSDLALQWIFLGVQLRLYISVAFFVCLSVGFVVFGLSLFGKSGFVHCPLFRLGLSPDWL